MKLGHIIERAESLKAEPWLAGWTAKDFVTSGLLGTEIAIPSFGTILCEDSLINAPAYDTWIDRINQLPKDWFHSEPHYLHTLYHELGHATGAEFRLARPGIVTPKYVHDSYYHEELIAELTALFAGVEFGFTSDELVDYSVKYLCMWEQKLRLAEPWGHYIKRAEPEARKALKLLKKHKVTPEALLKL